MELTQYQVDAFTGTVFAGNPAGVCPLEGWIDDSLMQKIAMENNLSETAFFVQKGDVYELRWFTPTVEIDLCGHATLASGYIILRELAPALDKVVFTSRSGILRVSRGDGDLLVMDFPSQPPRPCDAPAELAAGLRAQPSRVLSSEDYLALFEREDDIRALEPDFEILKGLGLRGVIATAPGEGCDFVSRFFCPGVGINEDPVTGSAHCELTPYWADRLGRTSLHARQVSSRGGELFCELKNDRVLISGRCALFMKGTVMLP